MGRPHKLNEVSERAIVQALAAGETLEVAARRGGVAPRTLRRWLELGRETRMGPLWALASAVDQARLEASQERMPPEPEPWPDTVFVELSLRDGLRVLPGPPNDDA